LRYFHDAASGPTSQIHALRRALHVHRFSTQAQIAEKRAETAAVKAEF
jgi:hypothetical protein